MMIFFDIGHFCFLGKLHINEFILYILFCVWFLSLSIMFLKFSYTVVNTNSSVFLLPIVKNYLLGATLITLQRQFISLLKGKTN